MPRSRSRSRRSRGSPRRSPYRRGGRCPSSPRRSRSSPRRSPPRRRGRGFRSPSGRRSPSRRRQRAPSRSVDSQGPGSDGENRGRIWVSHGDCARVIGKKGEARKEIEYESGAQLRIMREEEMDPVKKERYVELLGNLRQRRKAIEMILKIATFCRDDNGKVLKDGQVGGGGGGREDSIFVQQGEVGKVLGRGGENIRRIEEESGARLELDRNEGRLDMRGHPDAVARAKEMVLAEVSHARDGSGAVIKDEYRNQGSSARGPGGDGRGSKGGGGSDPGNTTWVLWVYSKEAGRVIGRGGEAVRDLIERTGADVKVQRGDGREGNDAQREVKISGSPAQKEEALMWIGSQVGYIRTEQGVIKSPEMSAREAEDSLRRFAYGGGVGGPGPWMGGPPPPGMMPPPPGMMPGMMMPGMPSMPPMPPPPPGGMMMPGSEGGPPRSMDGMSGMPGMPSTGGRKKGRGSSSSSSSTSSSGKRKKAGAPNHNSWMPVPWQAPTHNMGFPPDWREEEKKAIDWDEL